MKKNNSIKILFLGFLFLTTSTQKINADFLDDFFNLFDHKPHPEITINNWEAQIRQDLKGIGNDNIKRIVNKVGQAASASINSGILNQYIRTAIIETALENLRQYTSDTNIINSFEYNMIARLEKISHFNGEQLAQFFNPEEYKHCANANKKTNKNAYSSQNSNSQHYNGISDDKECVYSACILKLLKKAGVSQVRSQRIISEVTRKQTEQKPQSHDHKINIRNSSIAVESGEFAKKYAATMGYNSEAQKDAEKFAYETVNNHLKYNGLKQLRILISDDSLTQLIAKRAAQHPEYIIVPTKQKYEYIPEDQAQAKNTECLSCMCEKGEAGCNLKNIPCPNGAKHSDQVCSNCVHDLGNSCPICREKLRK